MLASNIHQLKNGILLALIIFLFSQLWRDFNDDNFGKEFSREDLSEESFITYGGQKWHNLGLQVVE